MKTLCLIPDDPKLALKADGLGFTPYAQVLAEAVLSSSGPFSVGIFGEWGTGKTSMMRMLEREIKENAESSATKARSSFNEERRHSPLVIWFNVWQYQDFPSPLLPLLNAIQGELRAHENPATPKINERMRIVGKFIDVGIKLLHESTFALLKVAAGKEFWPIVGISALKVAADMSLPPTPIPSVESISRDLGGSNGESIVTEFEKLQKDLIDKGENKCKVVIMLDDLDRCMPDKAVRLLESVKLLLCIPDFIFVVGISKKIILRQLDQILDHLKSSNASQQYLDKLFQLHLDLPNHSNCAGDYCNSIMKYFEKHLPRQDRVQFRKCFDFVFEYSSHNPRLTKSIFNDTQIAAQICGKIRGKVGKIGWNRFVVARIFQRNWPSLFDAVAQDTDDGRKRREYIRALLSNYEMAADDSALFDPLSLEYMQSVPCRAFLSEDFVLEWLSDDNAVRITSSFYDQDEGSELSAKYYPAQWMISPGLGDFWSQMSGILMQLGNSVPNLPKLVSPKSIQQSSTRLLSVVIIQDRELGEERGEAFCKEVIERFSGAKDRLAFVVLTEETNLHVSNSILMDRNRDLIAHFAPNLNRKDAVATLLEKVKKHFED